MNTPTVQDAATDLNPSDCASQRTTQLHHLHPGDRAIIVKIGGALPMRRRLAEMGLLRGVDLVIKSAAPLGDPIAYEVKGYHLALRRTDAAQIEVRLVNTVHNAESSAVAEVFCD